ncbi:MAG: FHA domain-containing protein [Planctomycetota bacterium]|jgi:hypothetical protein
MASMNAWLEMIGVGGQPLRFSLDAAEIRIGSVGTSDIWIPLPGVRRLHCRVEADGDRWMVRPAPKASVRLNGVEHHDPVALAVGDGLEIDRVAFRVRDAAVEIEVRTDAGATSGRPAAR